ncbi:MAG: hypothetical protein KC910_16560 [Candidatus Eremiobacteraeota bacterium]|nr:hypothetical protein [Candidatus Eremiobacteraeota bacterium]
MKRRGYSLAPPVIVGLLLMVVTYVAFKSWRNLSQEGREVVLHRRQGQILLSDLGNQLVGGSHCYYGYQGKFGERDFEVAGLGARGSQALVAVPEPDGKYTIIGVQAEESQVVVARSEGVEAKDPTALDLGGLKPKEKTYQTGAVDLQVRSLGHGEALLFEIPDPRESLKALVWLRNVK